MAAFEMEHLRAIKKLVEEEDIDCDFVLTRAVDVQMDDMLSKAMKENIGLIRKHSARVREDGFFVEGDKAEKVRHNTPMLEFGAKGGEKSRRTDGNPARKT